MDLGIKRNKNYAQHLLAEASQGRMEMKEATSQIRRYEKLKNKMWYMKGRLVDNVTI